MKNILLIALVLVSMVASAQTINQLDSQGKRHGKWSKNFENTKVLRYEGQFNHGKEIDTFKFYKNINGKAVLSATRVFNTNNDLALVTFYNPRGLMISQGKMKHKTYVGKWRFNHENKEDIMISENYNANGKLDGERLVYYENGQVAEKEFYANGVLEGKAHWYQRDGKLIRLLTYKNGILDGPFKSYDLKGELLIQGQYRNDGKHGIWKYYKDGKLLRQKDFTKRSKNPKKQ
ncbi:toxin-antitoxin system YwqK family antitoxin [Lacinutrix salivirga]